MIPRERQMAQPSFRILPNLQALSNLQKKKMNLLKNSDQKVDKNQTITRNVQILEQEESLQNKYPKNPYNQWNQEKLNEMYRFPATNLNAEIHKQATKFGYKCPTFKNKEGKSIISPVCPCCGYLVTTYEIPICYPTLPSQPALGENKFLLTNEASLFFLFVRMAICYMLFRFLILDAYVMYLSIWGSYCQNQLINKSINTCSFTMSGYNLKSAADQHNFKILDLVNLGFSIFSVIFLLICEKIKNSYKLRLSFSSSPSSKYSIIVNNFQKQQFVQGPRIEDIIRNVAEKLINKWLQRFQNVKSEDQLKDYLQRHFWKFIYSPNKDKILSQAAVIEVNFAYLLQGIHSIEQQRKEMKLQHQFEYSQQYLEKEFGSRIQIYNTCHKKLSKETITGRQHDSYFLQKLSGTAFITYRYQHYRQIIDLDTFGDKNYEFFKRNSGIIGQKVEPVDVNWKGTNFNFSILLESLILQIKTLLMQSVVSLISLFALQMWKILQFQSLANDPQKQIKVSYIFTGVTIILTKLINTSMKHLNEKAIKSSNIESLRAQSAKLLYTSVIIQMINSILLYYVIFLIHYLNPLSSTGLATKVIGLITANGGGNIGYWISFLLLIFAKSIKNKLSLKKQSQLQFQINFNKDNELSEFKFWQRYSFYIVNMFIAAYFSLIAPIASLLLVVFFFIQFWLDKVDLFKNSSVLSSQDESKCTFFETSLIEIAFAFLCSLNFIYALNYCIWGMNINYDQNLLSVLLKILPLLISLFARNLIKKYLYPTLKQFQHPHIETKQYPTHIRQNTIYRTYQSQNPMTFCSMKVKKNGEFVKKHMGETVFVGEQQKKYLSLNQEDLIIPKFDKQDLQEYLFAQQSNVKISRKRNKIYERIQDPFYIASKQVSDYIF